MKLIDCADAVKGHFCIGRPYPSDERYWEYYNKGEWVSAGQVFTEDEICDTIIECSAINKQLTAAQEELVSIKSVTWCAYCGHKVQLDDDASSKISEHIQSCPHHPMRIWERHCAAIEEQNKQIKKQLAATLTLIDRIEAYAEKWPQMHRIWLMIREFKEGKHDQGRS